MIPVELVAHGADLEPRGQFEIVPASGSSSPLASLCPAVGVGATDTAGAAGPVHDPLAGWSGGCRGRLLSPAVTDGEDAVAHARQGRGTILLVDFPGGLFKQFGPVFPLGRLRMLLHGTYACSTTGAESSRRAVITRVSGPMASAQDSNRSLFQGDFMFLWFPRRAFPARSGIDRRRHEDENGRRPRCRRRTRRRVPRPASRPGSSRAGPWGTEQYHAPRRGYGSIAKHLGLPPLAGAGRLRGKQGGSICRSPAPVPFLPRIPPRSGVPAVEPHDPFADVVVRDP